MKRFSLFMILMLIIPGEACAYVTDRVMIAGSTTGPAAAETTVLMKEMTVTIDDALTSAFPCLQIFTRQQLIQQLDDLRQEALLGPGGWQWFNNANRDDPDSLSQTSESEEEKAFQDKIDKKLQQLADGSVVKYLVHVKIENAGKMGWGVTISGINMKKAKMYYHDYRLFTSVEAAVNGAKPIAEKLAKGFNQYLSNQQAGIGEVCPFTGRVDVYREITRQRDREERKEQVYCNGHDAEWKEGEQYRSLAREVWSLERIGNPDTKGGVEATIEESAVREEVNPCYVCGPSEIGQWFWNRTVSTAGSINGLSDTSAGESIKNKDATIRLHFKEDGTYTVTVKAASVAGTQAKTVKESATGMCNTFSRNEPPKKETLRFGFEYTFGPFTGTPYDKKLADKIEVQLPPKEVMLDTMEETMLRIDFDLKRQGDK
jgi:hypothetical protein